jgi:Domain of unknown function (DUF1905)
MAKLKLKTTLHRKDIKAVWTYIVVRDAASIFNTSKSIPVKGLLDDIEIEGVLQPNSDGSHWLNVKKEWRQAIGKSIGDTVVVELEKVTVTETKISTINKK